MKYLSDPRLFNIVILVLFALATIRWAFAGSLKQSLYWGGAFILNYAITFLKD
jgi:hypothetical protein